MWLIWSKDPGGHAGGSVATDRVSSHAGQVKDDDPDTRIPWSPRLGVGREANNLILWKSLFHETPQMPRMVPNRNTKMEEMSWGERERERDGFSWRPGYRTSCSVLRGGMEGWMDGWSFYATIALGLPG